MSDFKEQYAKTREDRTLLREFCDYGYDNNMISKTDIKYIMGELDLFTAAKEQHTVSPKTEYTHDEDRLFDFAEWLEMWITWLKEEKRYY